MDAQRILDDFLAGMRRHPQLALIALMVAPYRDRLGEPAQVVQLLDSLVWEYAQARGLKYQREEATT